MVCTALSANPSAWGWLGAVLLWSTSAILSTSLKVPIIKGAQLARKLSPSIRHDFSTAAISGCTAQLLSTNTWALVAAILSASQVGCNQWYGDGLYVLGEVPHHHHDILIASWARGVHWACKVHAPPMKEPHDWQRCELLGSSIERVINTVAK